MGTGKGASVDDVRQYLVETVKVNREFAQKFQQEVLTFSCDNMNKLNVGGSMMVSRYHQINKIYMCDDESNYEDHDFNCSGYKIIPSGYLQLCCDEKLFIS